MASRCSRQLARPFALLAGFGLFGCSALLVSVGGGMTKELRLHGVSAPAEILEVWDTRWTINDDPVIGMKVRVQPDDRPAFEATIEKTTISRIAIPQFQPGNTIPVRFDPNNPAVLAVDPDGGAPNESAATSPAAPPTGNPYHDHFERANLVGASFLPPPAVPQLFLGTSDSATDAQTLFEHEYALLGAADVRNASNPQPALDQGREIGAALVVVYGHFDPPPGLALDVLPFPRGAAGPGQPSTPIPESAKARMLVSGLGPDEQVATYWGKTRPAILGILSRPLDAQEQARLHRQDGIVVERVAAGSPAAAAQLAVGDVIVAIDGQPLPDARAVPALITSLAGRQVHIDLLRNGSPLSVTAQLGAAAP